MATINYAPRSSASQQALDSYDIDFIECENSRKHNLQSVFTEKNFFFFFVIII